MKHFVVVQLKFILFKNICIYNNKGALQETIGKNNGLEINLDIKDPNYIMDTCLQIIKLINNDSQKQNYIFKSLNHIQNKFNQNSILDKWYDLL